MRFFFLLPRMKYNLSKLINRPITSTEVETEIKKIFQQTNAQSQVASQENSTKSLEKS